MRINNEFTFVRKRSSVWVRFDQELITDAMHRAAQAIGGFAADYLLARRELYPPELTEPFVDGLGNPLPDDRIARRLSDLAVHLLNFKLGLSGTEHPTIEEIQDAVEYALYASGLIDVYEAYRVYRWGRTKLRHREISPAEFSPTGLPAPVLAQVEAFNARHRCGSVAELNELVNTPRFPELVAAACEAFDAELDRVIRLVAERRPQVLIVAGCSSSGKSTTARLLEERLRRAGIEGERMELDHYFFDYVNHPRDRHGDFDYETPQALDLHQINSDVERLLAGEEVRPQVYDFEAGQKRPGGVTYSLRGGKLLILDSLYGVFPPMTQGVPRSDKVILHVEALHVVAENGPASPQVRPTDIRLLRRMIRDSRPAEVGGRGHAIEKTLGHWHYVRRGELRDLIPYIGTVDVVINGSFAFDLPVLKPYIAGRFPRLDGFLRRGRLDAYLRGRRVEACLERVVGQRDTSYQVIPKDCVIREFIGHPAG